MKYRHELKYVVDAHIVARLKAKLEPIMRRDDYDKGQGYYIRSLYFDDIYNSAFHEKEDGLFKRAKFRIRIYNGKSEPIYLEKKQKVANLTHKTRIKITQAQAKRLMSKDNTFWFGENDKVLNELLINRNTKLLRPRQLVDYYRTAYICKAGNVRITIDSQLSAPLSLDLFNMDVLSVPVLSKGLSIIEIKYDDFLPDYIAQAIQMDFGRPHACSKFFLCTAAANKVRRV